jgi:hypothetical protein
MGASMEIILLVIVLLLLFGTLPTYPYSRNWGYVPSGTLTMNFIVLLILYLIGKISF